MSLSCNWRKCPSAYHQMGRGVKNIILFPILYMNMIVTSQSGQSLSRVQLFEIPWTAVCQASLSITNSWGLLKPVSIELVMPSNHLILCRPLLHKCVLCAKSLQSCPTLHAMDCSPPGSSAHGILQARILKRVAISFSGRSS